MTLLWGGVVVAPLPGSRNSKPKIKDQKPCLLKKANPKLSLTAGAEKNGRGKAPLTIPSVMQACKSYLLLQGAKNFLQRAQKLFVLFPLLQHLILFSNHVKKGFHIAIANFQIEVNALGNDTKIYSSKEVAKRLSIQPVTVRKYSQILEEKGIPFDKDEKGWREYSEENIKFLEYLCNMKLTGKSLEESAKRIATLYRMNLSIAQPAIPLHEENVLVEFMKAQHDFNQKLVEQLERIEQRQIERDSNLIQAIRETQQVKKELAAATNQKWWHKLFKSL